MIQLYYISKAASGLTDVDYQDILAKSRRNNPPLGITGLLVVKGGFFAQVLEGPEESVMLQYAKIAEDKRHSGVMRLLVTPTETRAFPKWSMGFQDVNSAPAALSEVHLDDPTYVSDPSAICGVFRKFVED